MSLLWNGLPYDEGHGDKGIHIHAGKLSHLGGRFLPAALAFRQHGAAISETKP